MTDLKLSADIKEFLSRQTTADFIQAARQFVSLMETSNIELTEFLKKSHLALVQLYSAGHRLDEIPLNYSSADSDFPDEKLFDEKNAQLIQNLAVTPSTVRYMTQLIKKKKTGSQKAVGQLVTKNLHKVGWLTILTTFIET